jgi:glycosidase
MRIQLWCTSKRMSIALSILMMSCMLYGPHDRVAFGQATSVANKSNYETDTIYELMVDRFYDGDPTNNNPYSQSNSYDSTGTNINDYFGGDWQGVTDKMQYLQDLGITAIWITCPYDNLHVPYYQTSNSTYYNAYHGYWARDYFVPDAHWGGWTDFDNMVSAAHSHNIKVVIDFASNHTNQEDSAEQGGFYKNGTLWGNWANDTNGYFHHYGDRADNATTNWDFQYEDLAYLADFSQENGAIIQYMKDAIKVWLDHGIDGIRNDAVLEQDPAFLKIWQDYINNYYPLYTFGEFWINTPDPSYNDYKTFQARTGIGILDFELGNVMVATFGSFSDNMNDLANTLGYTATDYTYVNKAVPFLDSHDKERIASLQPTQSIEHAALAFLLTTRGTPVIYYGTEQYLQGLNGDGGRVPMPGYDNGRTGGTGGWSETTTAFKLINKLAGLRKSNDAIAYGTTTVRWVNNDVIIVERQFYNNVVLTAINRSGTAYSISGLHTALPNGTYPDYLGGLLGGGSTTVSSGAIPTFTLSATQVAVWQYKNVSTSVPEIGAVGPTMGRYGDIVTIDGEGFGSTTGTVNFGSTAGSVQSWSPTEIKVAVPNVTPGVVNVTVIAGGNTSNTYRYDVLSGPQVMEIFHTTVDTSTGQNAYVVGNIHELDNWDAADVYYPFFNPSYPDWFLPVSVPAGTAIQYKYVLRDGSGNLTWQPDPNLSLTTPSAGESDAPNYIWP